MKPFHARLCLSRDERLFLADRLQCCQKILRSTHGMEQSAFLRDELVFDAVMRNIEISGEAAKHIPGDVRDSIWDIISNHIPDLHTHLSAILTLEPPPPALNSWHDPRE